LQRDIGWNEIEYGNIVTAFQIAYMIGLLAFGSLIDRDGARAGYSLSVALWSAACAAHGLAHSVMGFGVARFALGLGEAGNSPAAVKAVTEWFPRKERALATGIFNSGANIGAVLTPLVVPRIAVNWGWQAAFVLLGAIGLVWLAACMYSIRNLPWLWASRPGSWTTFAAIHWKRPGKRFPGAPCFVNGRLGCSSSGLE